MNFLFYFKEILLHKQDSENLQFFIYIKKCFLSCVFFWWKHSLDICITVPNTNSRRTEGVPISDTAKPWKNWKSTSGGYSLVRIFAWGRGSLPTPHVGYQAAKYTVWNVFSQLKKSNRIWITVTWRNNLCNKS